MTASIYLDWRDNSDYHRVGDRMRSISQNIANTRGTYRNVLQALVPMKGRVSIQQFETALSIYENNQVFYQDQMETETMKADAIQKELTRLEHWFIQIIEPRGEDPEDRIHREQYKLQKGISKYCDPDLYSYIDPIPDSIRNFLQENHRKIGIPALRPRAASSTSRAASSS